VQIPASRPVRHDYLVNPANLGDAMALMMRHSDALPLAGIVKQMRAWLHDGCAFGSLLTRSEAGGFTLLMFSDHPDFDDETFELDDLQAVEWIGEADHHQARAPTIAEAKAASFSTVELAARWRCRRDTVDYMVEGGHLGAFRIGRFRRIRRAEVEKFESATGFCLMLRDAVSDGRQTDRMLNMIATNQRAERRAERVAVA
jgi:excisionase family DNA binding protein